MNNSQAEASPFLKWAGGKTQLLEQLKNFFPKQLNGKGEIKYYYEPFLGSGALFFWVMQNCAIEKAYINELNPEIYLCYRTIQRDVSAVVRHLKSLERKYHSLTAEGQESYYYKIRDLYNRSRDAINFKKYSRNLHPERVAMTIFLNRTCYNGLYRVNSKGEFNVPFGRYKNPTICNSENLLNVNKLLHKTEITNDDFSIILKQIKPSSFVYFDPPYRPLNKTSKFTSYSTNTFDDYEQKRLADVIKKLERIDEVKVMLSNSDPKNEDPNDDFFDNLYCDFNLARLKAKRMINCNATKRGAINEILVMNY